VHWSPGECSLSLLDRILELLVSAVIVIASITAAGSIWDRYRALTRKELPGFRISIFQTEHLLRSRASCARCQIREFGDSTIYSTHEADLQQESADALKGNSFSEDILQSRLSMSMVWGTFGGEEYEKGTS
jgi:hypothetical protein